jgi:hypothetical protein
VVGTNDSPSEQSSAYSPAIMVDQMLAGCFGPENPHLRTAQLLAHRQTVGRFFRV